MRLFISIDLPTEIRQQISQRIELATLPGLKPGNSDQLHITLAFLGAQPLAALERIEQTLADITIPHLEIRCASVHSFRSGVIWLAVEPDPALLQLQARVSHALRQIGIELEGRKYTPHITLFRCKKNPDAELLQAVSDHFSDLQIQFQLDAIWLKESRLHADGARHQVISGFH